MKRLFYYMLPVIVTALFFVMGFNFDTDERTVQDFSLKNVDGKMLSLKDFPESNGFIIIFTCNHCPFAKLYPQRMNELNERFTKAGVQLIAISSTDTAVFEQDLYSKMIDKSNEENYNFPYLYDNMQSVAKDFKAERTPHAFVIWKVNDEWKIKYNGAIDDNGADPSKVKDQYVADAVEELLNNEEVKIKQTSSIGCKIQFRN